MGRIPKKSKKGSQQAALIRDAQVYHILRHFQVIAKWITTMRKVKRWGGKFTLAALTLLVVSCIGAVQVADFDDAANTKVIQDYAQKLQDTYVFPAGGKQLADKVQQDLDSVVADQHNGLVYVEFDALDAPPPPPKPAEPVPRPVPDNFGLAKFDMRGKTAYLQMTRFAPVDRYSTEALANVMTQAAGSDAMIIDLRHGHLSGCGTIT